MTARTREILTLAGPVPVPASVIAADCIGCTAGLADPSGPPRAARPCPVTARAGRWHYPCHRTQAEVMADEARFDG